MRITRLCECAVRRKLHHFSYKISFSISDDKRENREESILCVDVYHLLFERYHRQILFSNIIMNEGN